MNDKLLQKMIFKLMFLTFYLLFVWIILPVRICLYCLLAHVLSSEQSSSIPEVVKSQQKFNLHLQERSFFHCSYSDAKDLKLETALEHCLLAFTSIDTLDEDNKFICQACSVGKYILIIASYVCMYLTKYVCTFWLCM